MNIEKAAAHYFQMSDDVWAKHSNPWSVWTRYPCLPLLSLAVWSRVWIGWMSAVAVLLVVVWIWLNPRFFGKPKTTKHWASKAVLGERAYIKHSKCDVPEHHIRAIRNLNIITFAGFFAVLYGLITLDAVFTTVGVLVTILGKTWFLDRMVWLYQDLSVANEEYRQWLY